MTDLIKQLNTQFCTELNVAWMNATLNNDGPGMDMSRFNELTELITEAREQGYAFNLEYSPIILSKNASWEKALKKNSAACRNGKDLPISSIC